MLPQTNPNGRLMASEATFSLAWMRRRSIYRRVTSLEMIVTALLVAAFGGVLIWLTELQALADNGTWRLLLHEFGVVLIASVALGLLWELVGKRAFAFEMFEIARVGADVRNAGLVRIGTSYLEDVEWEALFATVEKLDVFVAYGSTWRGAHFHRLRTTAGKPGTRVRVFLPDPYDQELVSRLALRFNMPAEEVRRRIIDAKSDFIGLRQEGGGVVEAYYHDGDPVFSCYRFDRTAIFTLYSHTRERRNVPTIVCRDGGNLYEFARDELRAIQEQARSADVVEAEQEREGTR
jgi:hypothetical protein